MAGAAGEDVLLTWHAHRAGTDVLYNALAAFERDGRPMSRVLYLLQPDDQDVPLQERPSGALVERIVVELTNPTEHESIYRALQEKVVPRLRPEWSLHVNVAGGTPAMHAVWLVMHAGGGLPAGTRLWASQYDWRTDKVSLGPVQFGISTYLGEIRAEARATPERATYDPEARSPARRAALERLARYARVPGAPLLLLGERGTGKSRLVETVVAKLKGGKKVVPVPCGAIEPSLADSILFGHERGAFTGALKKEKGLLEHADGGILFLDEIQDLPQAVQRKLVRVLQDRARRFRPVGGAKERSVDVELVCASNLPVSVLRERLDPDFYDRVSHLAVEVPPLRDCRDDLEEDWRRVWRELRGKESVSPTAPVTSSFRKTLATARLSRNFRDLQRLGWLTLSWWEEAPPREALDRALREWRESESPVSDSPLGSGTRAERIRWFRGRLAAWARDEFGTFKAAAEALACSDRQLRKDFKSQ